MPVPEPNHPNDLGNPRDFSMPARQTEENLTALLGSLAEESHGDAKEKLTILNQLWRDLVNEPLDRNLITPRCLSKFVNCAAKIYSARSSRSDSLSQLCPENFIPEIANEIKTRIPAINARTISNITWAFATLGVADRDLFYALSIQAVNKIHDFNPQNLANTAWAFAKSRIKNERLFRAIAINAVELISISDPHNSFNAQNLSNTAWAFATLRINNEQLFTAISSEARKKNR